MLVTKKTYNKDSRIAVYLRKSREDDEHAEDTLKNHRDRLTDFVADNNFTDVEWFEEIASGGSINERPVFMNLLDKIRGMKFDGVLVVAQDRLSRGDTFEQGIIERAFKETGTLVILPTGEVIDYNDKNQGFVAGIKASFANYELEVIKERMTEGKKKRVRDGSTHNGASPFGYKWNRNTKMMEIDEDEAKIYRMIVEMYLKEDMSITSIAYRLTDMKIPTPSGKEYWYAVTVSRLLKNDFHCGKVVYGRSKMTKNGRKYNDVPEIVTQGKHEPIKTEIEHIAIMNRVEESMKLKNRNRRSKKYNYRLSGLVFCKFCGKQHNIREHPPKYLNVYITKCVKQSTTRTEECSTMTKGITEDVIYQTVISRLHEYREKILSPNEHHEDAQRNSTIEIIKYQEQAVEKSRMRIKNAKVMFMDDIIERHELKEIVEKEEANILSGEARISELKASSGLVNEEEKNERKRRWSSDSVYKLMEGGEMSWKEINDVLRLLISKIHYTRIGNDLTVEIKFK